jgi:Cys-tRNA synthase (O-phospho-L-seryl-tRNA:Cys-tRNA synthase)
MNHRDAEITEVVVVVHSNYCNRLEEAVAKIKGFGVEVFSTDVDECVISGSIETFKVPELEKLDCVNYVRSVLTYIADFPVGDPRDQDLQEEDDEAEAV